MKTNIPKKNFKDYSNCSDHVTGAVMAFFLTGPKSSGETLLPLKLSFPCDATSSLCNPHPRPSLQTVSLKYVSPSIQNSNTGSKMVILNASHI